MDRDAHLRAGAVLYALGEYHAAHDPWEAWWLAHEDAPERPLFQGSIQLTAAIYHARRRNWSGTVGLSIGAADYLTTASKCDATCGVAIGPLQEFLRTLAADPEVIERRAPPSYVIEGARVTIDDLPFAAVTIAAMAVAEEYDLDDSVVADAARYGTTALAAETTGSPFVTLLIDVVDPERRGIAYQRLTEHVDRRRAEESDITGLFDA